MTDAERIKNANDHIHRLTMEIEGLERLIHTKRSNIEKEAQYRDNISRLSLGLPVVGVHHD